MITTEKYVELLHQFGRELVEMPDVCLIDQADADNINAAGPLEYSAAAQRAASLYAAGRGNFAVAAALCQEWQYRWAGRAYK